MVRRQSAAGYDTVNVRMALHSLPPRMQNTEESDLGPEVPRIGSDLLQGLGRCAEEDAVDDATILETDRPERRW